jgi:hypothetical protein
LNKKRKFAPAIEKGKQTAISGKRKGEQHFTFRFWVGPFARAGHFGKVVFGRFWQTALITIWGILIKCSQKILGHFN